MTFATFTNDWISRIAKTVYRGAKPPDSSKFAVGLTMSANLTRGSSIIDFVSSELLPVNGYSRAAVFFSDDGAYNTTTQRHEMPIITATFAATTTSFQFQTAFLMADASNIASIAFTDSSVNPSTDRITIPLHGFVSGDRLCFTADDLGYLPGGIVSGTLYQVVNPTTNDFQIASINASTPIDIQNTGSGTFRARTSNGSIVTLAVESSPITVLPGQGYTYQIPIVQLNTGYTNGI